MLQCVAVCCSVLQCVAVCFWLVIKTTRGSLRCFTMLHCVAVCYSVLQCVAVCCSVLQCVAVRVCHTTNWGSPHCCAVLIAVCYSVLQCVAVCCDKDDSRQSTLLRWFAFYCSVLQCVAMYGSVLQCITIDTTSQTGLGWTGGPSYERPPLKNANGTAAGGSRRWHLQIWRWKR